MTKFSTISPHPVSCIRRTNRHCPQCDNIPHPLAHSYARSGGISNNVEVGEVMGPSESVRSARGEVAVVARLALWLRRDKKKHARPRGKRIGASTIKGGGSHSRSGGQPRS